MSSNMLNLSKELLTFGVEEVEFLPTDSILNDFENSFRITESTMGGRGIYYISDLHLDHKLEKKYGSKPTKRQINSFLKSVARKLNDSVLMSALDSLLIFCGDISYSYLLNSLFFSEFRKINSFPIIVILGNHELWGIDCKGSTVDEIVCEYRSMLDELCITLLNNDIYIFGRYGKFFVSEKDINNSTDEELLDLAQKYDCIILGGTGFSGYNKTYNATSNLYLNTIRDLENDCAFSENFLNIYYRIQKTFCNNKLFIVTHMPKRDWCPDSDLDRCIYISGHTHQNTVSLFEDRAEFADNQVGYNGDIIGFMDLKVDYPVNIFADWEDGKYLIPGSLYVRFYHSICMHISFDESKDVLMLKRAGYYCFFSRNVFGVWTLLCGGKNKDAGVTPNTIYNSMAEYAEKMEQFFSKYNSKLKDVSKFVKSIGGDGRIHGCIVDIDYYNHLYLNPFDEKLTPYYATSKTDKYMYPSIENLLESKCPKLLDKFYKKIAEMGDSIFNSTLTKSSVGNVEYYSGTDIYSVSGIFLTFQYLTKHKIIRSWNTIDSNSRTLLSNLESFDELIPASEPVSMTIQSIDANSDFIDMRMGVEYTLSGCNLYFAESFRPLVEDAFERDKTWAPLAKQFGIKKIDTYNIFRKLYFSGSKKLKARDFRQIIEHVKKEGDDRC